jgi:hypothetical protein
MRELGSWLSWAIFLSLLLVAGGAAAREPAKDYDPAAAGPYEIERSVSADQRFDLIRPRKSQRDVLVIYLDARADRRAYDELAEHLASYQLDVALARGSPDASALAALRSQLEVNRMNFLAVGAVATPALELPERLSWADPVLVDPEASDARGAAFPGIRRSVLILRSARGACERMADELLASLPERFDVVRIDFKKRGQCGGSLPIETRRLLTAWFVDGARFEYLYADTASYVEAFPDALAIVREPLMTSSQVPQFNVSTLLLADFQRQSSRWQPGFAYGLRPELIFGRRSDRMWGAGGYLQVSRSSSASGVLLGAGGTLLVPLWQREGQLFRAVALAPSLGGYLQKLDGFEPGATASLFFGYRTFNPISSFDMALGVRASVNWGFGASRERSFALGLQMDLTLLIAAFAG